MKKNINRIRQITRRMDTAHWNCVASPGASALTISSSLSFASCQPGDRKIKLNRYNSKGYRS
ncbi:MAG: hypothetical protein WCY58_09125 [Mariniphaga sp.]|nr:hypothetical protein [Mariniphaga sp.]MDD4224758.1 hypothetical protein [Mariniphaga sp.]